uniref:insulin-like growth factor-binding protein 6 isoform X2 n=1 Tax=Podarcis muralis TaxID=64176 RepID=UPI00109FD009|nr:insulin-like growth factor-binding protein 6 isoform X2 [Podarcis muralis]
MDKWLFEIAVGQNSAFQSTFLSYIFILRAFQGSVASWLRVFLDELLLMSFRLFEYVPVAASGKIPGKGDGWEENHHAGQSTAEPLLLQSQDPLQEVTVGKTQLQQLSLGSAAKQERDMAPCRRHLAAILQELKAPLYQNGQDIFIPNCDTKGFYRRKQCQASKGQKRGQCWCVDKRGRRLEGMEEKPLCLLPNGD